jgi:hypothetical protein
LRRLRLAGAFFSSDDSEFFAIKLGHASAIFTRRTMTEIVEKPPVLHNVYLRDFWPKNTISCGRFDLLTKHIVFVNFFAGANLITSK